MSLVRPTQRASAPFIPSINLDLEVETSAPRRSRPVPDGGPGAAPVLALLSQAVEALDQMQARCAEVEAEARATALRSQHDLAGARAVTREWEARAVASETQAADLEANLAQADETALAMRAKLVCVYGRLASSSAGAPRAPEPVPFRTAPDATQDA